MKIDILAIGAHPDDIELGVQEQPWPKKLLNGTHGLGSLT